MDDATIRTLVAALDTSKADDEATAWDKLKPLGATVLPFFLEQFPKMKRWQGRASVLVHSIRFARDHDQAIQLAILATKDRATLVRYRACMLLAYSLKKETIPYLRALLNHPDLKTVADAKAAIDAIQHNNHHYFIDRQHTGRVFWNLDSDSAN